MLSQIGPTNSITLFILDEFLVMGIILWNASYRAGRIKSFIPASKIIKFLLSPFFYNSCKFEPSCSSYCLECFEKYNIFKATYKSTLRILRCNPWFGLGGHDPVEKIKGEN